jgi:hypothetical protein
MAFALCACEWRIPGMKSILSFDNRCKFQLHSARTGAVQLLPSSWCLFAITDIEALLRLLHKVLALH